MGDADLGLDAEEDDVLGFILVSICRRGREGGKGSGGFWGPVTMLRGSKTFFDHKYRNREL